MVQLRAYFLRGTTQPVPITENNTWKPVQTNKFSLFLFGGGGLGTRLFTGNIYHHILSFSGCLGTLDGRTSSWQLQMQDCQD